MLNLYIAPSSASSRKARQWLRVHNIPFRERNIKSNPLNVNEIINILRLTENGCSDILSVRSNIYKFLTYHKHINFGDLSLMSLVRLMVKYPDLIRRPIIFNKTRMEVGYNEEEIRRFLPRDIRNAEFRELERKLRAL